MTPTETTVTIEKIVAGGLGLARLADGMVALLPFVLPGETVRLKVIRRHKSYLECLPEEIITASPHRTAPSCPVFGRCGGCDLQHASYPEQLQLKAAILREHLLQNQILSTDELLRAWEEPLPSPQPLGYRQRIRLQIDRSGRLGYHHRKSHEIESIDSCPLAQPELNEALKHLSHCEAAVRLFRLSSALELSVSPANKMVLPLLHYQRKPRPADRSLALEVQKNIPGIMGVLLTVEGHGLFGPFQTSTAEGTAPPPDEKILLSSVLSPGAGMPPLTMTFEPGGFCQVNTEQNENLVECLLKWAEIGDQDRVLDLFCGMGNFSLPLALKAREVIGMDQQRAAIRSAKRNAALAGIKNCRFESLSGAEGVASLDASQEHFQMVLLDPPRQGCLEIVPYLARFKAEKIIYISCDPATLARDLSSLQKTGYTVRRLRLVDMFPQTHHLETMVLLTRV